MPSGDIAFGSTADQPLSTPTHRTIGPKCRVEATGSALVLQVEDATPLDIQRQYGWSVSAKPLGAQSGRFDRLFGVEAV